MGQPSKANCHHYCMCVHLYEVFVCAHDYMSVHLYDVCAHNYTCVHTIIHMHIYMVGRPEVNLRFCFLEPSLQILRQDLSLELGVHSRG